MYQAVDKILDYVISKGLPFMILLLLIYLTYRYFVYGKGNKTLLCPSMFGTTYNKKCLNQTDYIVDLQGNLVHKSDINLKEKITTK